MRADMEMLLFLFLLTVSKVLGRGLTIDPTSFTTHDYTPQVDHIVLLDVYSQVAAIGDPVSQFCCGEPPRRQHKLSLQLPDPLACPVLLSLVNHTSHMIQLRTQNFYMFLHKRFCIIWDRCGHCQRFAPFWQALAEDIKGRQTDCHLLWVKAFDNHLEKLSNFQSRLATPCQSGCYQLCGAILW